MKQLHLVIPDLFLPRALAQQVSGDLALPMLEKLLARATQTQLPVDTIASWLCHAFKVAEAAIAPVTLIADGLSPGSDYWVRVDPVHLNLNRSQMILQTNVVLRLEDAQQLCVDMDQHFEGAGLRFFAPHPTRWYVRLPSQPQLMTHAIDVVEGRDSRAYLPAGEDALKWHGIMNEIQMLLAAHPIICAGLEKNVLMPNSIWPWGGGMASTLGKPYTAASGSSELTMLFAKAAQIPFADTLNAMPISENMLYVDERLSTALRRGDFFGWREAALNIEATCMLPAYQKLKDQQLDQVIFDVMQEGNALRFELTRQSLWKVWRRTQPLSEYSVE